jgi:hypothetical protein
MNAELIVELISRKRTPWMHIEPSGSRLPRLAWRAAGYELRFQSLFHEGRAFSFPCDASGHVDLDELSDGARNNCFFAHSVIGRDLARPAVLPCVRH